MTPRSAFSPPLLASACLGLLCLSSAGMRAASAADVLPPPAELRGFCAGDPSLRPAFVRTIVGQELAHEHDTALDGKTPEQILEGMISEGVSECVDTLTRDPGIYVALNQTNAIDKSIAWDAYNSACGDKVAARGPCIIAEVSAQHALIRMSARNEPPGAHALVQTCELALQPEPGLAQWRECVDIGLSARADPSRAEKCKLGVPWHTAHDGRQAGEIVKACLLKK